MAPFDRFWQLHDQALATLVRVYNERPLPPPTSDEANHFNEFVAEFAYVLDKREEIDVGFLKKLVPLADALANINSQVVAEGVNGFLSPGAQQVYGLAIDASLGFAQLLGSSKKLLEDTRSNMWGPSERSALFNALNILDTYCALLDTLQTGPETGPLQTGPEKLAAAKRALECATGVIGACEAAKRFPSGWESLGVLIRLGAPHFLKDRFDEPQIVNLTDNVAIAVAAAINAADSESARKEAIQELFPSLESYMNIASVCIAAKDPIEEGWDSPRKGAAEAWVGILNFLDSCDSEMLISGIQMFCMISVSASERLLGIMHQESETHRAAVAAAGRAATALRRVLPLAPDDHAVASIRAAVLFLECVRSVTHCKEYYGSQTPFRVPAFCDDFSALAAAWAALLPWVCEKGVVWGNRRVDVLTSASNYVQVSTKDANAALKVILNHWDGEGEQGPRRGLRGPSSAQDTLPMLHMSRALSVASAVSMAMLERSSIWEHNQLLYSTAMRMTQLRLFDDSALGTLTENAAASAEAWVAAQAAVHAAVKQGMVMLDRWDVMSRAMKRPHERLEMAVHTAATVVGIAMKVKGPDDTPEKQKEMGAMYAALFHLINQAGDKLEVERYPLDGVRISQVFSWAIGSLMTRVNEVPLLGAASALELVFRLTCDSAVQFKNAIGSCLRVAKQVNPKDEAQAVLLAGALGTLPCASLSCTTLPTPGREELELEFPRAPMPPTTRANGAHAKPKTKPFLRGVSHTFAAVASLAAGAMLTADAPAGPARLGSAIYTASLTIMFTISSIYHRPTWGLAGRARMRKLDHAGIYFIIAGTYTPLCLLALDDATGRQLLGRVWTGAALGIVQALFSRGGTSSKLLSALLYIALGWFALPYTGAMKASLGYGATALIVVGGVIYSLGAIIYAAHWPDPVPETFGYHEIFHAAVILAAGLHFVAVRHVIVAARMAACAAS